MKGKWDGKLNEFCILPAVNTVNEWECPIKVIIKFWRYCGKPTSGYMFSIRDKIPSANVTARLFKQMAVEQGLILPGKHSNRISCATTLKSLGASNDKINIHLHWSSEIMHTYYTKDFLLTEHNSPANLLAKALENSTLDDAQDHIPYL